jgi:hypothetical protein
MAPSFWYFQKMRRPSTVQRFAGDIYAFTALLDDRTAAGHWRSTFGVPLTLHIGVAADGTMRVLKEATAVRRQVCPTTRSQNGRKARPFYRATGKCRPGCRKSSTSPTIARPKTASPGRSRSRC